MRFGRILISTMAPFVLGLACAFPDTRALHVSGMADPANPARTGSRVRMHSTHWSRGGAGFFCSPHAAPPASRARAARGNVCQRK